MAVADIYGAFGRGAITGLSAAKAYASLQASGMNQVDAIFRAGLLNQTASSFQKSRYIRTGKDYTERALEKIERRSTATAAAHNDMLDDSFLAHAGRKGMKRGMNIFNPDYKPIGKKAQPKPVVPLKKEIRKKDPNLKTTRNNKEDLRRKALSIRTKQVSKPIVNRQKQPLKKTQAGASGERTVIPIPRSQMQERPLLDRSSAPKVQMTESSSKQTLSYAEKESSKTANNVRDIIDSTVKNVNPTYGERLGDDVNCQACTLAYEVSRRGYDVSANLNDGSATDIAVFTDALKFAEAIGENPNGYTMNDAYDDLEKNSSVEEIIALNSDRDYLISRLGETLEENGIENGKDWAKCNAENYVEPSGKQSYYKDLWDDILENNPDGSRGAIGANWATYDENGNQIPAGGHSIAWEIVDGELKIIDNQIYAEYGDESVMESPEAFEEMYDVPDCVTASELGWTRLDDKELNEEALGIYVKDNSNNKANTSKSNKKSSSNNPDLLEAITRFTVGDDIYNIGKDILDKLLGRR